MQEHNDIQDECGTNVFEQAIIEITDYCNFKCIHCYNDASHYQRSFDDIKKNIDIFEKLGVKSVILTGGEVLTYYEFEKVYRYLCQKNFEVTIFTNGSKIFDYKDLWIELPPSKFSISLYGINEAMYKDFTKTCDMFKRVKAGMDWIFDMKIPFEIKVIVTKKNIAKVMNGEYTKFANHYNTAIRYGMELFETELHSSVINDLRLDVDEMVSFMNLSINDKRRKRYLECEDYDPIYQECKAGRSSLAVNSRGEYCICLRDVEYGYISENIDEIRQFLINRKNELNVINSNRGCASCKANDICNGICSLEPSMPGSVVCNFHNRMMKVVAEENLNV